MEGSRARDAWLLAAGVAVLSSGSIFALLAGQPPLLTAFLRTFLAALPLAIWAGIKGDLRVMNRRDLLVAAGSGILLALHLSLWFASMGLVSVAVSLVLLYTAPLWTMVFGALSKTEPFHQSQLAAVLVSLAGIGIIAAGAWSSSGTLLGAALALFSGMALAGYTLCAKARDSSKSLSAFAASSYLTSAGALAVAAFAGGVLVVPSPLASLGWILAMTLCSQLIGHTTVNWAAGRLGAVTVGQVLLLEPVIASLLAWLVFGQSITVWQGLGGAAVICGAVISVRAKRDAG